ncbi:hypothetical protein [Nocardia salmonicida]|uniref:hypothetical protein n=1 Tax=Nocardia salmonicida TaxID=53431 RepID=UPI003643966A
MGDENDAVAVAALYHFVDNSLGFGVRPCVDADLDGHLVALRASRHEFVRRNTSDESARQPDHLG